MRPTIPVPNPSHLSSKHSAVTMRAKNSSHSATEMIWWLPEQNPIRLDEAVAFALEQIERTCLDLAKKLPDTFAPIRINYAEPGYTNTGFQLGESGNCFIQLFVAYNSMDVTLTAIASKVSTKLFHCRRQTFDLADHGLVRNGRLRWDKPAVSHWIKTQAAEAAKVVVPSVVL